VFHEAFRPTSRANTAIPFFDSKITTFSFERQHKQARPSHFLYVLTNLNIERHQATKKDNGGGSIGSKSKMNLMKSYKFNKKVAEQKLKKQKKENALDIISKSIFKPF
jgi:hypothetical protein